MDCGISRREFGGCMIVQTADNAFSTPKYIVSKVIGEGTHSTISSALTAATSGDTVFVKPGVYEEDLSLKVGVDITAFISDPWGSTPNVTIIGNAIFNTVGDVVISGISLKTNSNFFLSVGGGANGIITLFNCFFDCIDNTGISMNQGNPVNVFCRECKGDLKAAGISFASLTSAGSNITFSFCGFANTGRSILPTTATAGAISLSNSLFNSPIEVSLNASLSVYKSTINTSTINIGGPESVAFATKDTSTAVFTDSYVDGGHQPAISVDGTSHVKMRGMNSILSDNAVTVGGSGTLEYAPMCFPEVSNNGNVTVTTRVVTPIGRDVIVIGTINSFIDGVSALSMTEEGELNYPLHPAFSAVLNTDRVNVTGTGTVYQIIFDTEIFDQGNDFDLGTSTYTAPVSGKHRLSARANVKSGTNMIQVNMKLITSNRNYDNNFLLRPGSNAEEYTCEINQLVDMDAGDTAYVEIFSSGEVADTNTISGNINNLTAFSGNLEV